MSPTKLMQERHDLFELLDLVDAQLAETLAGVPSYRHAYVARDLFEQRRSVINQLKRVGFYADEEPLYLEAAV